MRTGSRWTGRADEERGRLRMKMERKLWGVEDGRGRDGAGGGG